MWVELGVTGNTREGLTGCTGAPWDHDGGNGEPLGAMGNYWECVGGNWESLGI